MEKKTLTIVQHILVIAVALFTFDGLSFSLFSGDTGFSMLSFQSYDLFYADAVGLGLLISFLCWLQCSFSLVAIVLSIISIFIKKESTVKRLSKLIIIGGVVFSFLYMLEGIIETAICNAIFNAHGETAAFVPFLLNVALMITYFILSKFAKNMPSNIENDNSHIDNVANSISCENVTNIVGEENANRTEQSTPMVNKNIDSAIFYVRNYISDEKVMSFRNALVNSNVTDLSFISMIPLKNPTTVLLFSIFLGGFGVDRFYIGDTGLGVAKLLLSGLTLGIWPLVDIFMCYKKAKEQNYTDLLNGLR